MSILTMFEIEGDPDELFALQEEKLEPIVEPLADIDRLADLCIDQAKLPSTISQ